MQQIDTEINRQQSRSRSDIQEEFYKVITDQIETFDPESGKSKYLPSTTMPTPTVREIISCATTMTVHWPLKCKGVTIMSSSA